MPEIKVAPSILAGDFARMGETVRKLEETVRTISIAM